MTKIRAAFRYNDTRVFPRVVTLLRGGDSAHCEIAHAWAGQRHECVSSSFLDGGMRGKSIDMPAAKWRIYELQAFLHPLDYLREFDDAGYDVLGLLGILLPPLGHSPRRRFCSEVGAEIVGLQQPHLFDLRTFESVCALLGSRVQ